MNHLSMYKKQKIYIFCFSCNSLQRNIELSRNDNAIPAHLKKQIHKIMDKWFCCFEHNKAMIVEQIYIISEFNELSKFLKGSHC